jgi:hypothetical protein
MGNLGIGEKKDPVLIREPTIKPFSDIFPPLSFIVPGKRIARIAKVYKTIRLNKTQEIVVRCRSKASLTTRFLNRRKNCIKITYKKPGASKPITSAFNI